MVHQIFSNYTASISDLKKQPMSVVNGAHGEPVAILNRNHPVFYCISAQLYESLLELLDDQRLAKLINNRKKEKEIGVKLSDL